MILRILATVLIPFFIIPGEHQAQDTTYSLANNFELVIDGDSNVRDWDAKATRMEADFILNGFQNSELGDLRPEQFKTLKLRIPVSDLDSDSRRLNRNLHDYLKVNDHPVITFELKEVTDIEGNGNRGLIYATGEINAAGVSHTVEMEVNVELLNNGSLKFSGVQPLLMTHFGIEPPTALLGSIRARDEMDIYYSVTFTR